MPYYGGKVGPAGKWVADLLPDGGVPYVEPYAGMLGVLLNRRPAPSEIVNDLNKDIANWWRIVRDDYEELARRVALTPFSRDHVEEANHVLYGKKRKSSSRMDRAWALHVCLSMGMNGLSGRPAHPGTVWKGDTAPYRKWLAEDFAVLAERMANVQIECRDAIWVMNRVAGEKDAVVYVDPPYRSTKHLSGAYKHVEVHMEGLTEALEAQKGRVAVSGYGDEWDHLGWRVAEYKTVSWASKDKAQRTERLWMNYEPDRKFKSEMFRARGGRGRT